MQLKQLTERFSFDLIRGSLELDVSQVESDSRKIIPSGLFVAIVGANSDGHTYLKSVADSGAAAAILQKDHITESLLAELPESMTLLAAEDTRLALAYTSAAWYGYPAEQIPVIGITGTKGKTTTTYMIRSILENAGYRVGLIGTIESIVGSTHIPSANTTPESSVIHRYLREMIDAGQNCAVMEVSSQALMLHRTAGSLFEIGVFTNLSPDHIGPNEHSSFEEYLACKSRLFRQCRHGIFNADDPYTAQVMEGHTCTVETYGIENPKADLRAENVHHVTGRGYLGMSFRLAGRANFDVELDLPGLFSVYNALTAVAVCEHFHIEKEDIRRALKGAKVRGRIEPVKVSDDFTLMIDYAHNAMALQSLLTTLRDYESGRIVYLFGCGGNRAKSRRFEMGEVSGKYADFTIITSDNPRFEEPQAILDDIVTGIRKTDGEYITIIDRKEAIRYAIKNGRPGDIIVLAGKGHEDYQEICGKKYPMDERILIGEILDEEGLR